MKIEVCKSFGDYYILKLERPAVPDRAIPDHFGHLWYPHIDQWCEEIFGPQDIWGGDPITGWKRMYSRYYFTKEEMLSAFILRWK